MLYRRSVTKLTASQKLFCRVVNLGSFNVAALKYRSFSNISNCSSINSKNLTSLRKWETLKATQIRGFQSFSYQRETVSFLLADIGEGITECEIVQWFVKEGEKVNQFDKICEVQSDKASVEITSRYDGAIKRLHHKVGDMAKVGTPLVDIETESQKVPAAQNLDNQASKTPSATVSKSEVRLAATPVSPPTAKNESSDFIKRLAVPAVRGLAKKHNIDISAIEGTGKSGRVTKEDILLFIEKGAHSGGATPSTASPKFIPGEEVVKSLTPIQKAMFKAMTKSLTIPHFGYCDEITMGAAKKFRSSLNAMLEKNPHGEMKKISYMPIFIKALSVALQDFPQLNAMLVNPEDVSKAQLKYRPYHNIGLAMDTPQGLIVPNIKNVEQKSILEVAEELQRLMEAGKRNSLPPDDLKNGTITLSNVGMIGGTYLSPVLQSTELCIGAIGKIERLPRFEQKWNSQSQRMEEVVTAQEIMKVSWSADHRVVDGATVARFVSKWKDLVENPALLAAQLK